MASSRFVYPTIWLLRQVELDNKSGLFACARIASAADLHMQIQTDVYTFHTHNHRNTDIYLHICIYTQRKETLPDGVL